MCYVESQLSEHRQIESELRQPGLQSGEVETVSKKQMSEQTGQLRTVWR